MQVKKVFVAIGGYGWGLLLSVLLTTPANATTAQIVAEVRRTLAVGDEGFGGCMVSLSVAPSEEWLDCSNRWVTFSCTGTLETATYQPRGWRWGVIKKALEGRGGEGE